MNAKVNHVWIKRINVVSCAMIPCLWAKLWLSRHLLAQRIRTQRTRRLSNRTAAKHCKSSRAKRLSQHILAGDLAARSGSWRIDGARSRIEQTHKHISDAFVAQRIDALHWLFRQ
jgi:hypothetical protein